MKTLLLFSVVILLAEVYLATIQLQQPYIYNFRKTKEFYENADLAFSPR